MDAKESMHIPGVGLVSFNQARDEYGRVTVLHRVHAEGESARQMARMTGAAAFRDCRIAFTECRVGQFQSGPGGVWARDRAASCAC